MSGAPIVDDRRKDILFDVHVQGRIVSMEEQKTLDEVPAGARAVIQKAVGAGRLVLVERVTRGEATFFEVHFTSAGRISEVKVDAEGRLVG